MGFLCLRVGCFPGDILARRSFFAGLLVRGCLFLEPLAAISVAPSPSTPTYALVITVPTPCFFSSSSSVWELKYCQCLLFQYFWFHSCGHQYCWVHSKFCLAASFLHNRCFALVLVCPAARVSSGVYGCSSSILFRSAALPVVFVRARARVLCRRRWMVALCSICSGCLISLGIWPWQESQRPLPSVVVFLLQIPVFFRQPCM